MLAFPPLTGEEKRRMAARRKEGLAIQARARAAMGPEPLEEVLRAGRPAEANLWGWPCARLFQFIRCRLGFTQHDLARRAGLAPSQISRLERGRDCLLSTWRRAYAAMGVEISVAPFSMETIEELEARSPAGGLVRPKLRPHGPWFGRRRPRGSATPRRTRRP